MRHIYKISVLRAIFIMSVIGTSVVHHTFVNFAYAQTLEEKVKEAKIAQPFQSFEAEIKSMQSFIEKLDTEIIEALKAHDGVRISDLQHGQTQAVAYQTYLRVQQNYILEKTIGGKPSIIEGIKTLNTEINNLSVADESLDALIKNKIDGTGGRGGKVIKTDNSTANSLLKDLEEDLFGKNKATLTESEAVRLRQTIHRRMARLSSAMDALQDIQTKGNALPTVREAQSNFFSRMKRLVTTRGEYPSYGRLRDFIYPNNRGGFVINPLPSKQVLGGMQKAFIPREAQTTFKEAISSNKARFNVILSDKTRKMGKVFGGMVSRAPTPGTIFDFYEDMKNAVIGKTSQNHIDEDEASIRNKNNQVDDIDKQIALLEKRIGAWIGNPEQEKWHNEIDALNKQRGALEDQIQFRQNRIAKYLERILIEDSNKGYKNISNKPQT